MQGGTRRPTAIGSDFGSWLAAREPALHRTATLLTGDEVAGRDLALPALARLRLEWSGLDPLDADDRARTLLLDEHRRTWGRAGADEPPAVPPGGYADGDAAAWALVRSLPGRTRAVVVLRLHQDLDERETADLVRLSTQGVRLDEAAVATALRVHLDKERSRHPERPWPGDPAALLARTLHDRGEAASYLGCHPDEIEAASHALRTRRRRRATVGLVAAVAVVLAVGVAVLDPPPAAPERPSSTEAPVVPLGPLGSFPDDASPAVPILLRDIYLAPGMQRLLPVAHPRSATPFHGDLWVTDLYFDVYDTLRRIDEDGRQIGKWATSGDPVLSADRRAFAWVELLGTRSVIHRGADRQEVDEPIALVGLRGDRVVFNEPRVGGAWTTDLGSPPERIPGVALAWAVDPTTGDVAGTATDGAGVVVDARSGAARWKSRRWRPLGFSPDGRYVVADTTTRGAIEYAVLDATSGRPVAAIHTAADGTGILDVRWEDDTHVLMLATAQGQSALLRADLGGTVTEATRPLPGDTAGSSAYRFAMR